MRLVLIAQSIKTIVQGRGQGKQGACRNAVEKQVLKREERPTLYGHGEETCYLHSTRLIKSTSMSSKMYWSIASRQGQYMLIVKQFKQPKLMSDNYVPV